MQSNRITSAWTGRTQHATCKQHTHTTYAFRRAHARKRDLCSMLVALARALALVPYPPMRRNTLPNT